MKKPQSFLIASLVAAAFGCSGTPDPRSKLSAVINKPGACSSDPNISGFSNFFISCRDKNMNPNLMLYCMSNYQSKFDSLSADCRSDFEGLAPVRKGVTTFLPNAVKFQLGLSDPAKKDIYDQTGLDQASAYVHSGLKAFSEAFYAKDPSSGEYVPSIEGFFSQVNALFDQKMQSIALKDKTRLGQESALKYEVLALESALKTYAPGQGSDLFVAARLRSALGAIGSKLDTLARVHDMACSISSCIGSASESNLVALVRVLGNLGEPALSSIATAAKTNFSANSDYARFLGVLGTYGSTISAVTQKAGRADSASKLYFSELKKSADGYRLMSTRFSKEGFFRDTESHVLAFGFSEEARDSVRGLLSTLKASLLTDKAQYDAALDRLFTDLQNQSSSDTELEKTRVSLDGIARDIASNNLDILGLEEANRNDEGSLARYSEQMKRIVEGNKDLKNSFESDPAFKSVLTIKASDSKFSLNDLGEKRAISKLSVARVSLLKGQTLNLAASGEWSPVCALKEAYGSVAQFRYETIKTGPDGYSSVQGLNSSTTNSRESFNSFVVSDTNGSSMQSCVNSSLNVGASGTFGGGSVGTTGNQCRSSGSSIETSHGYRDARTASDSIMDSASFQGGLTLPKAPFQQYPAGSLLAFVNPVGEEDLISARLDVKVLGRQTAIYAPENVTVSFVINDCQEGNFSVATGLSLQGEILTPKTAGARSLMENILARLPEFRKSAEALLKQGLGIDEQLSVKKAELIASLSEADATFFKVTEIQAVVNFWIDNEILRVRRMAQINAKGREMARLSDEANRLSLQQDFLRSNVAAYRIRLSEALGRLLLSPLESSIGTVSDVVVKRILPVLKFYALADTIDAANSLKKSISLEVEPFQLSLAVDTFLKDLSNSIEIKTPDLGSGRQTSRFALRFPRPGSLPSTLPVKSLPTVDEARSISMWRALLGHDPDGFFAAEPAVNVTLSDVYSKTKSLRLSCKISNVVIDDMALVFLVDSHVNSGDMENLNHIPGISMQAGPDFEFTQPTRSETYMLRDPNEGNYNVRVGFLPVEKALSFEDILNRVPFDQNAGKGLSPFTSFKFEARPLKGFLLDNYAETLGFPGFAPADDPLGDIFSSGTGGSGFSPTAELPANVTDILLAFKVRGLSKNGDLTWIESCQ